MTEPNTTKAGARTHTLDAEKANKLQKLWNDLDSTGPKAEIERVIKLYGQIPTSYIAQNANGVCAVHLQGQPLIPRHGRPTFACSIAEAEALAKEYNIQTILRWDCNGQWFNA